MKNLIKEIKKSIDIELTDAQECKIIGVVSAGKKVKVLWTDRETEDSGYSFCLPEQDPEIFDICLHITSVDNSDGIGDAPEEWVTLLNLLTFDRLKSVEFITN